MRIFTTGTAMVLTRVGALAAVMGGAAWVVKAGTILVTGHQPPLLFEVAPVLFAVGIIGLRVLLGRRARRPADVGGWLAIAAFALAAVDLAGGAQATSEANFSPITFIAFLSVLAALVLIGLQLRQEPVLPPRSRRLPLMLGILTFPLVAVGGALETIDERLLEVPLLCLGGAWVWLGSAMMQAASRRVSNADAGGGPNPRRAGDGRRRGSRQDVGN